MHDIADTHGTGDASYYEILDGKWVNCGEHHRHVRPPPPATLPVPKACDVTVSRDFIESFLAAKRMETGELKAVTLLM